jgi:FkbM family methyltransferase
MQILYGAQTTYVDVTYLAFLSFWQGGYLIFPASDDERATGLGDPLPRIVKTIKVRYEEVEFIYEAGQRARIKCPLMSFASRRTLWETEGSKLSAPEERLSWIHRHSRLPFGSMTDEYPEQLMVAKFLHPSATVLELGANIGRNTTVIATVLDDDRKLVALECDPRTAAQLRTTRDLNSLRFHVEASALSRVKLCQRAWQTVPYEGKVPEGHTPVQTITFPALEEKYQLRFDTLVADCEGALYYILQDEPALLENFHTVILENDFLDLEQKKWVDAQLAAAGLREVYRAGLEHWSVPELREVFFQVFRRE